MKILNRDRGFTLIELLVVIAIIGILAGIVYTSLKTFRQRANDARLISDVRELRVQIESDSPDGNFRSAFYPLGFSDYTYSGLMAFTLGVPQNSANASTYNNLVNDAYSFSSSTYPTSTLMSGGGGYGITSPNSAVYIINDGVPDPNGNTGVWGQAPKKYAIWGKLSTGEYFCLDSTNNSANPAYIKYPTVPGLIDYQCK